MEKVRRTPASLKKMVEIFSMEILHKGRDFDNTVVTISDVNRPALQLVGFYDYFDDKRLQILGRGEMRFLDRMTETERVFNKLLSYPFPALIVARDMDVPTELVQMAEKHDRTLLRSAESTVDVTSKLIDYLNRAMAPQIARHGVLMNISAALLWQGTVSWATIGAYLLSGFPVDCVHAAATVCFLWLFGEPMLEKLDRIKVKYGLLA